MAYNGAGLYSLPAPEYPAVPGTTILAEDYNTVLADLATALSSVLVRDGQSAMTGNLNLGGFGLTNVTSLTGLTAITADAAGVTVNGNLTFAVAGTLTFNGTANFLGTTTVPTKAVGTNTTDAASCAFVQAVAMNAALPAQAGNAGKFVKTDGATASWASSLPDQTGNAGKFIKTDGATESWAYAGISTVNATITTSATLAGSYLYVPVQMAALGKSITLPDATTLSTGGPQYIIDNTDGGYPAGIRDSAGTLLMAVAAGGEAYVSLRDNSTAAGVWSITGTNLEPGLITIDSTFSSTYASTVLAPYVALDDNKSIHFAALASGFAAFCVDNVTGAIGVPVTVSATASYAPIAVFKITATTAMVFYSAGAASQLRGVVVSLTGATTLAVGTPSALLSTAGVAIEDFSGAPKIAQLDSTHYLLSYATATGAGTTSVAAFEVTAGTTCTLGASANIIAADNVINSTTTYALTATTALVLYKSGAAAPYANNGVVISVSGTVCTVGTPAALTGVGSSLTAAPASCILSATKCLVQDDNNIAGATTASVFIIAGTTVTPGTPASVETGMSASQSSYTRDNATRYNPHIFPLSASTALLWYFDNAGRSRAVVLSESAGTVTKGTITYNSISFSGQTVAGAGLPLPQGTSEFVAIHNISGVPVTLSISAHKISGTTITQGANTPLPLAASGYAYQQPSARLSTGQYVLGGFTSDVTATNAFELTVFSTNGDALKIAGGIKVPALRGSSTCGGIPAVSSNRVVILGATYDGTTVGTSTYQLRLLNVEIAA